MDEQLPNPGETLEVNGETVAPVVGVDNSPYVEVPSNADVIRDLTKSRKALSELPAPPAEMNTVAVVLYYSMAGIADADIGTATGLDLDTVRHIKTLDSFNEAFESLVEKALEFQQHTVRGVLEGHAMTSVTSIIDYAKNNKGNKQGFAADKEILDRAGFTAKTIVEHKHNVDGGLTINVIKKDQSKTPPTIELNPKQFEEK